MIKNRSQAKELIDLGPHYYSLEEYKECMQQLFYINQFFGFFKDTVRLLKSCAVSSTILDIGCGNGMFLLHLHKIYPQMQLIGVEISESAIKLAQILKKDCQ